MNESLVSIIMPVYNGADYVSRAINSVLSQTYSSYELIIVDDGSTDNSQDIIAPFLSNPKIKYISQANAGVAATRNNGIAIAQGEFVALLDQDDIWLPDKLALQIQFMANHPDIGLLHTAIQCINNNDELISCKNMIWVGKYEGWCTAKLIAGNGIAPLTILARIDLLKRCGGFAQTRAPADDWDLWLRMSRLAPLGFLPDICAHYRIHDCNESRNLLKMKRAEITVLNDYLADFKTGMSSWEKYLAERKLAEFCTRAAVIAEEQGLLEEASGYTLRAHELTQGYSLWHCRDRLVERLPDSLRKRLAWYLSRLTNFK
jgi:glycosyltransferase involved in cell wall biosynthesis